MRKGPKVLVLGWEFPPVINGGLGVACHDLCVAMSKHADLSVIIPRSDPNYILNNINLIGLNNISVSRLQELYSFSSYEETTKVKYVETNLNPYYSEKSMEEAESFTFQDVSKSYLSTEGSFSINELYGNDVIRKVMQYSEIACALSEEMDFDIIHAHDWMTIPAAMKIKERTGKPMVIHIHSLEVDRSGPESKGWMYQVEKNGMEMADLLIPVSSYTGFNIEKYYGISTSKISPVHNGIRPAASFKSKRLFREKTVLFIGRLTYQKGPGIFLEIAEKVLSVNPDVRFVMAGTGDSFRKLLHESSYRKIGNRFHLTGFLGPEELRYLLSIADVYCMPSVSEPFGLSAVEAAQFGVPCVISRQSGVSEVLPGSLRFDSWDTTKAADCILRLISDPVLSKKVADDAFANLDHISWDLSARKVIDAYYNHGLYKN